MKKFTYDTLISLLDDPETSIQEQALLIFRVLLYNSPEEIEEVFTNCKDKLLGKIYDKISNEKNSTEIIMHSLYVLSNISNGNEKQKSVFEAKFIDKIMYWIEKGSTDILFVCMIILNNLLTSLDMLKVISERKDILQILEKVAFRESEIKVKPKNKEENEILEDLSESKQYAMQIVTSIKNYKKKVDNLPDVPQNAAAKSQKEDK